jgi:hypothetical protein
MVGECGPILAAWVTVQKTDTHRLPVSALLSFLRPLA